MASTNLTARAWTFSIKTADGCFVARYSETGLCGLDFPGRTGATPKTNRSGIPARVRDWNSQTEKALKAALAGKPAGELPPLDLTRGTPFQRQVWMAMRKLGPGE